MMIFLAIKAAKFIVANDYLNQFMLGQLQKKQVRNQEKAMQEQMEQAEAQGMAPPGMIGPDMAAMMGGQEMTPEMMAQLQGGPVGGNQLSNANMAELEKMQARAE